MVKAKSFMCTTNSTSGHVAATEPWRKLSSSLNIMHWLTGLKPTHSDFVDQAIIDCFSPS